MLLLILGIAYTICLGVVIWAMITAPMGYEDEAGFHFGPERRNDDYIDRPLTRRAPQRSRRRKAAGRGTPTPA